MADREREKKKKRAYLDDFEKDLNGNYQYRGAHYRYAGEHPHSRVLALLWLFCGSGAALTVGAGALPGATAHAPVYLLLPYMAALVLAQNLEDAPPAQQAAALKNMQSPVSCFTVRLSNVARMLCSLFVIEKLYLSGPAAASPAFMRGVVQKLKSPEMRPVVLNPDPVHTPAFMATDLRQSLLCSTDA